jgi:broad specificity phosphatase PhoE
VPTLTIVRHGATTLNEQDRLRGWMDPPLSYEGKRDAANARRALLESHQHLWKQPVYSSDLSRARETALYVFGDRVKFVEALRPWNVGTFAGQPSAIVHPLLEEYRQTDGRVPFGERFSDFTRRLESFVRDIHVDAVIVTHYRVVKQLKFMETGRWDWDGGTGEVVTVGLGRSAPSR